MFKTTTSNLWNELNDQQAENVSGGDGAAVVVALNPKKGEGFLNYGQFLTTEGLSAKESNGAGRLNPTNVIGPTGEEGEGANISAIATS